MTIAVRAIADPFAEARQLFRQGSWSDGLAAFNEAACVGARPDAQVRLLRRIAAVHTGEDAGALAGIDAELVRAADGRKAMRRQLVAPLIRAGHLDLAATALEILVEAYPASAEDLRTLASVLARMKRWDSAIPCIDLAAELECDDPSLQAARMRIRLQAGEVAAAAAIARMCTKQAVDHGELAQIAMMALLRDGDAASASRIAVAVTEAAPTDGALAGAAMQALQAGGMASQAIEMGNAALAAGNDGASLRLQLGQAHLAGGSGRERYVLAAEHLEAGVRQAPDNIRLNASCGEALLRSGRFADAVPFLEKACTLQPALEQARVLHARALKHSGRYEEAADALLDMMRMTGRPERWERVATAALSQAGREADAQAMFDASVARRREALPSSLAAGLEALWERAYDAPLPKERLDWAWSLRAAGREDDPVAWERAARWGHLADHLLLDWLECRDDRAEEAMALFGDLDAAESRLATLTQEGRGILIASAHVGAMYMGPIGIELIGLRSRWLASTPSIARSSYAQSLISTSDHSETQVAKATLRALQEGCAVAIAVDGAASPAAPRIPFEGQEITYSSFAARSVFRTGAPSTFCVPRWNGGKVEIAIEELPRPEAGEAVEIFASRWRRAYLAHLRETLAGRPENLRLSGGLWRHVSNPPRR